ncbi:hypothetical protein MLD38_006192 [Melastoma candidum]|uniref:Uncharacterized protein n=1 Tax=Melastoma candidum TaxID=119954 RepID=A0ACB9RQ52_9MYRT|nr:hypothetical protein MLD38_006192 [Melastoma candidum]
MQIKGSKVSLDQHAGPGFSAGFLTRRIDPQIRLLHLKPDPNTICQMRSPFLTLPFALRYASSYHMLLLEVFPNLWSVILDASMFSSLSSTFCWSLSRITLLATWMLKCLNASL